ncbi:hypothetical protein HDU91_004929 [Kappamyces sp. JEL0680]|nr:hypothetical protein HDU91_004929 [Kappamyces sp. JEL0680]
MYSYNVSFKIPSSAPAPDDYRTVVISNGQLTLGEDKTDSDPCSSAPQAILNSELADSDLAKSAKPGEAGPHSSDETAPSPGEKETKVVKWTSSQIVWISPAALNKIRDQGLRRLDMEFSRVLQPKFSGFQDTNSGRIKAKASIDLSLAMNPSVVGIRGRFSTESVETGEGLGSDHKNKKAVDIYKALGSTLGARLVFSSAIVNKRGLKLMTKSVQDYIPKKSVPPNTLFEKKSKQANVEYKDKIKDIVNQLVEEYRHTLQLEAGHQNTRVPLNTQSVADAEKRKKMFLFHLNKSGAYFNLKEQLKASVVQVVRERFKKKSPFTGKSELQLFMSEVYVYLIDEMHSVLGDIYDGESAGQSKAQTSAAEMSSLKEFADEAEWSRHISVATKYHQQRIAKFEDNLFDYGAFCLRNHLEDLGREAIREILSRNAKFVPALLAHGMLSLCQEKYDEARTFLTGVLEIEGENILGNTLMVSTRPLICKGVFLESVAEETEAERYLNTAKRLSSARNQGVPRNYHELAEFAIQFNCGAVADKALSQELILSGPSIQPYLTMSSLEIQRGDMKKASEFLMKALEINKSDCLVWAALGNCTWLMKGNFHYIQKKYHEAKIAFDNVLSLAEKKDSNKMCLDLVYRRLGHIHLKSAYNCNAVPNTSISVLHSPGVADENAARLAKTMYLNACSINATSQTWLGVGRACFALGEYSEAEDAFAVSGVERLIGQEANYINNRDSDVWAHLAILCLTLDRLVEANQAISQSLRLGIQDTEVLRNEECITGALGDVVSWNIKQGTSSVLLSGDHMITAMARHGSTIAIGYSQSGAMLTCRYADGSIRVTGKQLVVLNGHRAAVTSLAFDGSGVRLASGSSDTDIVLWDIVSEEGLHRFKGHKDQVTSLVFVEATGETDVDHLVSGSKDSLLKVWDINGRCCVETIASHKGEVWTVAIVRNILLSGSADGQIRVWDINYEALATKLKSSLDISEAPQIGKAITPLGTLDRTAKERVSSIVLHSSQAYFAVLGVGKSIDIYKIRNEQELAKTIKRKQKRAAKKAETTEPEIEITINDRIALLTTMRTSHRARSLDFMDGTRNGHIRLLAGLSNNSIELYEIATEAGQTPPRQISAIDLPGHRSDIRALALSDDDGLILSGSNDRIKLFSMTTGTCVQTLESGYTLCCSFLPGSKHAVVGTKTGEIQIFELSSSTLIESVTAHDGPIWSMQVLPDKSGLVTGSQDKQVKFWSFHMVGANTTTDSSRQGPKRLSIVHTRTLKLSDDVLSVRISPDGRLLAVALLDLTVKIFYTDSLKFFLSLYGHKLPVVSMDISFDSRIIITASSDKTVKIWGLDFGDCHRSIMAHEDAVMSCHFVWGTYYFFTASKDKKVKYFDGEKFEEISTLEGHQGEVWSLAVGKYGNYVVTGSHDKSIRVWEKTDEQFVLSEEREQRLDKLYESMDLSDDRVQQAIGSGADTNDPTSDEQVHEAATRANLESMKSGEILAESLKVWTQEHQDFEKYNELLRNGHEIAPPTRNPFVLEKGAAHLPPAECVLIVVKQIRPSHLNDALLTLPFSNVADLIRCIAEWVEKELDTFYSSRILGFLLREHHDEIVSNRAIKMHLERIRNTNRKSLLEYRDKIGFNLFGLQALLREQTSSQVLYLGSEPAGSELGPGPSSGKLKRKVTIVS